MKQLEYHDKIIEYLKAVGAIAPHLVPGGKHPKIVYGWNGEMRAYVVPGSPSDIRGLNNALSDLRYILGNPPVVEDIPRERRKLEDMMPVNPNAQQAAPRVLPTVAQPVSIKEVFGTPATVSIGAVAHYPGNKVHFLIPKDLQSKINWIYYKWGWDKGLWQFEEASRGPKIINQGRVKLFMPQGKKVVEGIKELGVFGRSDAEYTLVDGKLLVAPPKHLNPYKPKPQRAAKYTPKTVKEIITEKITQITPTPVVDLRGETFTGEITSEYMHQVLDAVRRIEANTSYTIVRHPDTKKLSFVAPRIE